MPKWTEEAIAILTERYPEQGPAIPELLKERNKCTIAAVASYYGIKMNPEALKKSRGHNKGKKLSKETRTKMGEWQRGSNNPSWKGGKYTRPDDAVNILSPNHPFRNSGGYVPECRLIMEKYLKENQPDHPALIIVNGEKYLSKKWHVRHKDKDAGNNKLSNLELMGKIEIVCRVCGKKRAVYTSILKRDQGIFCSNACKHEYQIGENNPFYGKHLSEEAKQKISLANSKEKIKRVCKVCGKPFNVFPSRIKASSCDFCSLKCAITYMKGENNPVWKGGEIEVVCLQCGTEFKTLRLEHNRNKCCSKECATKYFVGENHSGWKGGAFPYYGPNWRQQKRKALENAGYKSQISSERGKVDVHHIYPIRDFIQKSIDLIYNEHLETDIYTKHFKIIPYDMIPNVIYEEMNAIKNLVVLTKKEHPEFEGATVTFFRAIHYLEANI